MDLFLCPLQHGHLWASPQGPELALCDTQCFFLHLFGSPSLPSAWWGLCSLVLAPVAHAAWSNRHLLLQSCPLLCGAGVHFNFGTPRIPLCHRVVLCTQASHCHAYTLCPRVCVLLFFSPVCLLVGAMHSSFAPGPPPSVHCSSLYASPLSASGPTFWPVRLCVLHGFVCPPSLGLAGAVLSATSVMCTGEVERALSSLNVRCV